MQEINSSMVPSPFTEQMPTASTFLLPSTLPMHFPNSILMPKPSASLTSGPSITKRVSGLSIGIEASEYEEKTLLNIHAKLSLG